MGIELSGDAARATFTNTGTLKSHSAKLGVRVSLNPRQLGHPY